MYKCIYQKFIIKSTQNDNVIISGYASVYNVVDQQNDIISQGAFLNLDTNNIKFLWQHDPTKPIGTIKSCNNDNHGLLIEAIINRTTQLGYDAVVLVTQKAVTGLSIGLNILESNINKLGQRIITKAELLEISIVTFPSNSYAQITNINNYNQENTMDINNQIAQETKSNETTQLIRKIQTLEEQVINLTNVVSRPYASYSDDNQEYKAALCDYIRKGNINDELNNIVQKSFNSSDNEGGQLIHPTLNNKIISNINARSILRQIASVETISTNALDIVIEDGKFVSGWVGEAEQRGDTETPKLKQKKILVHEMYAQPKATQALIDDSSIQIDHWLSERISDSFIRIENEAFINGTGNKQPKGILHESNNIKTLKLEDNLADQLLELINDLDENYLANATFLMNRATLSEIQKLKDANGRSIWQQSISDSMPQTIYGIPVMCCAEIPPLQKKANCIIFGDFKSAYKIVDRMGINIMRDPYTEKPFVKFYTVKRVGGDVILPEALRVVTTAA